MERKQKVIPCRGTEDRNGVGTNSGKSGPRNLCLCYANVVWYGVEGAGGGGKRGVHTVCTLMLTCMSLCDVRMCLCWGMEKS